MFLFWDKRNDTPEILGDDGLFYSYGEDEVAIEQGCPDSQCRYWIELESRTDITPLNNYHRYDIFDPQLNEWVQCECSRKELWQEVQRLAGVKDWKIVN